MSSSWSFRPLGATGIQVAPLGFGAGGLGEVDFSEKEAESLLGGILDLGLNLIDTAPSYGCSEERIGRHLSHRRKDFVLSTKCGYGVPGVEDWTPRCVTLGVELALKRLRTEWLDIVHFHSCPLSTLRRPGLVEALEEAQRAGKLRVVAYSGEGDALQWAIDSGRFQSVQSSVNLCDQWAWDVESYPKGMGLLGKRALANGAWAFSSRPERQDVATYWDRLRLMDVRPPEGMDWVEYGVRFAAFAPSVASCLVGTRRLERFKHLRDYVEKGPLPPFVVQMIRQAYLPHRHAWAGLV